MGPWTQFLLASNDLTLGAIVVIGFSLFAYIAQHNWRNAVAQSFCLLLGSLLLVLLCAILLRQARTPGTINVLWRIQWIGIVFTPAAYVHFALELLRASGSPHPGVRALPPVLYVIGMLFWMIAAFGSGLAETAIRTPADIEARPFAPFDIGPLFWPFCGYVLGLTAIGIEVIRRARKRAMLPAGRRRLFYLSASFMAPLLGVIPCLLIPATTSWMPLWLLLIVLGTSTAAVGVMLTLMTYSVAYHGVIVPDRVVKYNFLRYLLYGPSVGVVLVLCLQIVDPLVRLTGLPASTISFVGVMLMTVLMPVFIANIRPTVDMLIYRQDRAEIRWLRGFEQKAFTRSDLRQLLENSLIAICGTLRCESGFVAAGPESYTVQVSCGPRRTIKNFLQEHPLNDLMRTITRGAQGNGLDDPMAPIVHEPFSLLPLHATNGALIGVIGVACQPEQLTSDTRLLITTLAHQMELALNHIQLQDDLFNSLRGLSPQTESLHQITSELEPPINGGSSAPLHNEIALQPDFAQVVKDALSHYWGGPKLSDSPLLGLRTVRALLDDQGGSPTRALQAVLRQAIENIRPDEQLDPTAPEWMLYNILELRFLRGHRIREIVDKLAMSESDYYRKQRVAVEEVARQLALMEDQGERSSLSR